MLNRPLLTLASLWLLAPVATGAQTQAEKTLGPITGELMIFAIDHTHPFYRDELDSSFAEGVFKLGTSLHPTANAQINLRAGFSMVRGDSRDLTFVENETETALDLWNLQLDDLFVTGLSMTLGRQELRIGDGFVVWDGASDQAAIWTGAFSSLTGARLDYRFGRTTTTLFSMRTNREFFQLDGFLGPHEGKSSLHGVHLGITETPAGDWELGVFARDDDSVLDNDTLAFSLRGTHTLAAAPRWTLAGEYVKEIGHTKILAGRPAATTQDRDAWAGHFDVRYRFGDDSTSPYVKLRRVLFSGDDPTTNDYEGYDPMFFGWVDWGQWYLGSISSWEVFSTNERVSMLEVGAFASRNVKLRAMLFDIDLDREWTPGAGRQWSREINLILDWTPSDKLFCGVAVNYARPQRAAKAFVGDDNSRVESMVWVIRYF